jgi:hypothetical protein
MVVGNNKTEFQKSGQMDVFDGFCLYANTISKDPLSRVRKRSSPELARDGIVCPKIKSRFSFPAAGPARHIQMENDRLVRFCGTYKYLHGYMCKYGETMS